MTELQNAWFGYIEDYYGDEYSKTKKAKVAEVLPKSKEALSALYNTIIRNVDDRYGKVPGVKAVEEALNEVIESRPELTSPQIYPPKRLMIEDNGVITEVDWAAKVEEIVKSKRSGNDPTTQDAG